VLIAFVAAAYALAWTFFGLGAVASGSAGLRSILFYLGAISPSLAAIVVVWRREGRSGVTALLSRLFIWRVHWRWYVFAVAYLPAIKLSAAVVHRVAFGTWPRFGDESWLIMIVATFAAVPLGGQAGEEVGWRGFALPRLANRFGVPLASVLLGVIWAVWHLPLFFIPGVDKTGQSFPLYAAQVTALSIVLAWVYTNTNGSLLLVTLMHSAVNQTIGIVPSADPGAANPFTLHASRIGWITAGLLWGTAAYFLVRLRGRRLTLAPTSGLLT
jgi:membrane protease YdiL (CAAX protease family)